MGRSKAPKEAAHLQHYRPPAAATDCATHRTKLQQLSADAELRLSPQHSPTFSPKWSTPHDTDTDTDTGQAPCRSPAAALRAAAEPRQREPRVPRAERERSTMSTLSDAAPLVHPGAPPSSSSPSCWQRATRCRRTRRAGRHWRSWRCCSSTSRPWCVAGDRQAHVRTYTPAPVTSGRYPCLRQVGQGRGWAMVWCLRRSRPGTGLGPLCVKCPIRQTWAVLVHTRVLQGVFPTAGQTGRDLRASPVKPPDAPTPELFTGERRATTDRSCRVDEGSPGVTDRAVFLAPASIRIRRPRPATGRFEVPWCTPSRCAPLWRPSHTHTHMCGQLHQMQGSCCAWGVLPWDNSSATGAVEPRVHRVSMACV